MGKSRRIFFGFFSLETYFKKYNKLKTGYSLKLIFVFNEKG